MCEPEETPIIKGEAGKGNFERPVFRLDTGLLFQRREIQCSKLRDIERRVEEV